MTNYEKNIAVICKQWAGLAEKINSSQENLLEMQVEPSVHGEPTLIVRARYVHSKYNPVQEAQRAVSAEKVGEGIDVVLGFGLGYAAESAARNGGRIIVIEKHMEILKKALETRDLTDLFTNNDIIFVIGGAEDNILGALQAFDSFGRKERVRKIKNRALVDLDSAYYQEVERRIDTWISKDTVNEATLKRFGGRWEKNFVKNKHYIHELPGIMRLKGILKGEIPVFLVAAGPSIDDLTHLPKIVDRCLVVSVDTALRFLLKHGIDPDFTISADPQYWNTRHLDVLQHSSTYLVTSADVYPLTFHLPCRKTFLYSANYPPVHTYEEKFGIKGRLGSGGSVATTAFDFACWLGAASMWIAGLDLGFPKFRTHFKGALFEEKALATANRFCPSETKSFRTLRNGVPFYAPTANGRKILTDKRLSLYAAWFESRLRDVQIPVHSLSPDGLVINGMKTADIEALLQLHPRRNDIKRFIADLV
ncbi:MAG: DUF115 domain-containing protein [Treponema sp.]|jgi:hypothetical protein|nr:DUF115 domain-containing protein [Treponema sp.]